MPKPTHRTPSDKAKARWGNKARPPGPQRKGWSPWKGTLADALPPTASRKDVFHCESLLQGLGYDTLREGVTRLIEREANHVKILDAASLASQRAGHARLTLEGAIMKMHHDRAELIETLAECHAILKAAGMDYTSIPDAITHLIETRAEARAGLDAIGQAAFKLSENSHNFRVQSIIAKIEMMRLDGQKLQTKLDAKAGHPRPEDLARVEGYAKELEARIKNQASTIRDLQERLNALTAPVVTINTTFKPEDKAALENVMEEVIARLSPAPDPDYERRRSPGEALEAQRQKERERDIMKATPAGADRPEPVWIAKVALRKIQAMPGPPEGPALCDEALRRIGTNETDSREDLGVALHYLHRLAMHGNGDRWGTSTVNETAQRAIMDIERIKPDAVATPLVPHHRFLSDPPAPAREKPPLGLVPRNIRRAQRLYEILAACERHLEHYGCSRPLPGDWLLEADDLNHETEIEAAAR